MSLKTDTKNYYNLLILINFLFHNKIKLTNKKTKLKTFSKKVKINLNELEKLYNFSIKNKYIYIEGNYLKVNWTSIDNLTNNPLKNIIKTNMFIIENNLDIIVKPEINLTSFNFLTKFAEIIKKDVIYKFKITPNSLHNAYNLSITKEEILNFLKKFSMNKKISDTVKFLVNDIHKRTGEINISVAGGIITANKFIIKEIKNIPELKKFILKFIDDNIILLTPTANLNEIFYLLKEKTFYPSIKISDIINNNNNNYILSLNNEEIKYFLTTIETLKIIGTEHNININFNILDKLSTNIKMQINATTIKESNNISKEYKKTLDSSIKSYVLQTLKHSIRKPHVLITNKLAVKFQGENPATTKKTMRNMINYAINNKLLLFIEYVKSNLATKSEGYIAVPEYLYNDTLICKIKETKEELKIALKNISYIILL